MPAMKIGKFDKEDASVIVGVGIGAMIAAPAAMSIGVDIYQAVSAAGMIIYAAGLLIWLKEKGAGR
jgi:hypothetical protein